MCLPLRQPRLLAALRLSANGTLDTAGGFGTGGVASFGTAEDEQFDGGVVIKPGTTRAEDKILLAGSIGHSIWSERGGLGKGSHSICGGFKKM